MAEKEKKPQEFLSKTLFEARLITIFGEINMDLAQKIVAQLWALSVVNDDPIKIIINSPGGHVEAGDTIHDMIKFIKPQVKILGTGWVASAGALIYVAARKENRFSLPNTRYLIHQPLGSAQGAAVDFDIQARQMIKMKERLNRIMAHETGQAYEKVARDAERDYWLFAEEAKEYGLVNKIITKQEEF